jgi:hypothetical protein
VTTDWLCPAIEFLDSTLPGGIIGFLTGGSVGFEEVIEISEKSDNADLKKLAQVVRTASQGSAAEQRCPF